MKIDDTRPIWIQMVDEFSRRIASGTWPPGSRLPSVRELAAQAGVNPNTVQRALAELDRSGLTAAERTAGRFVTTDATVVAAARTALASDATDDYITTLTAIGMDLPATTALLSQRWRAREAGTSTGEHS